MSEMNISGNALIDEVETVIERLESFTGIKGIDISAVVDFIEHEANTHFYIDEKLNIKEENDKNVKYLWMDTGLMGTAGNPVFLSMIATDGYYIGHYVGDLKLLSNNIMQFFPTNIRMIRENIEKFKTKYEKRADKRTRKHLELTNNTNNTEQTVEPEIKPMTEIAKQLTAQNLIFNDNTNELEHDIIDKLPSVPKEITEEVIELLMINNWKTVDGLDRYLKIIGCRLIQLIEQNQKEYYILNNIKSAVVNTGLLNQFGADIHIMYRHYMSSNVYVAYKIMDSKMDYLENKFTREQLSQQITPINFFNKGEELFEATKDDFDVNHKSLMHIIEERRERFPENVRNLSANTIATKINNALDLGLTMQKRDRNYAKPSYSTKSGTISWMMPLHINRELTEEPELVLVIRRNKEFYEIKTIIPYDDEMKDRITALSLYNGLW